MAVVLHALGLLAAAPEAQTQPVVTIHLALLRSHEQAKRYVMNNQLDIDHLALSDHHLFCDTNFDPDAICNAIRRKRTTRVQGTRDMTLFAKNRPQIEHHYEIRLRRCGATLRVRVGLLVKLPFCATSA